MASKSKPVVKPPDESEDFFDSFRENKICQVPWTWDKKKPNNAFSSMRPKDGAYLDYKISETDTKLDAGPTRIHIKQVTAHYQPFPPGYPREPEPEPEPEPVKKRRRNPFHNKYFHGRGPVWEFAEEKWEKEFDEDQIFFHDLMERRLARKKYEAKYAGKDQHNFLMELCGPDWFQELSPKQFDTVDCLKSCIETDIKFGIITHTQENIGELGIVLRPFRGHIKLALKHCCKCPVEFLLTLYQLMNPNRTKYSLNDRLLLSAVVHLTIQNTLKEMHIRIPSPPRDAPDEPKVPEKVKPIKYESPYLIPYTFKPEPRKHTGIYKNNYIQYPRSPYFAYLRDLRNMRNPASCSSKSRLRMYSQNKILSISNELEYELGNELIAAQRAYNELVTERTGHIPRLLRASVYQTCDHRIGHHKVTEIDEVIEEVTEPIEEVTVTEEPTTDKTTSVSLAVELNVIDEFNEFDEKTKTTYKCKVDIKQGPIGCGTADTCNSEDVDVPAVEDLPIDDDPDCGCSEPNSKTNAIGTVDVVVTDDQVVVQTNNDDEEKEIVVETQLVPIDGSDCDTECCQISQMVPTCKVLGIKKKDDDSSCKCRDIIVKQIEDGRCQCDKCVADREKANLRTTYVISGTRMAEDEPPVRVISDVKIEKRCTCLERYEKRADKVDHKREIRRVQDEFKSIGETFIINGTATGPDGKLIYNISGGVAPKRECCCVRTSLELKADEERIANMPVWPEGRQKYVISGVHAGPKGNVYILSGVVPMEDCNCMQLYDKFTEKHFTCLELYDAYLKKIEKDTEEYMQDLKDRNTEDDEECLTPDEKILPEVAEVDKCTTVVSCEDHKTVEVEKESPETDQESDDHISDNMDFDDAILTLSVEIANRVPLPKSGKRVCICNVVEEVEEVEEEEVPTEYKRYIIKDKIPEDRKSQREMIKKVLAGMAEDGFPLANLPDCHKLPIFQLWLALRTRQCWKQEDRHPLLMFSKRYWSHIYHCKTYVIPGITLGISNDKAKEYTWADNKFVKGFTSNRQYNYLRKVKQASVSKGREFFPTTCSYKLPTENFRKCFFAYSPGKEENTFVYNVWKPHEFKNVQQARLDAKRRKCSIIH